MAGRWATEAVHIIPVFGEKGGLVEHMVFDLCFNYTHAFCRRVGRHIKSILNVWMLLGTALLAYVLFVRGIDWSQMAGIKVGVNLILAYVCLFLLPRVLFYPLLRKKRQE